MAMSTSAAFGIAHLLFLLWLGRYFWRKQPRPGAEAGAPVNSTEADRMVKS
jgi:hypothetical protein